MWLGHYWLTASASSEFFVDAPSNNQQKSPQRQQCENQAANKYNATINQITSSLPSNAYTAAKIGGLAGLPIGCLYGAIGAAITVVAKSQLPVLC